MKCRILSILLAAGLIIPMPAVLRGDDPAAGNVETKERHDARMAWWHEAKFGLFIHWGVYSVPAGVYHDKPVSGIGEWIMNKGKIPCVEYQAFAKQFNPVRFNADEWVQTAKNAGMKYIVITTKHHDGFAMFCSKASQWNICDGTPFKRDPIKELAEACRKQDIKLGFYYSQAQDWNNGGSASGGKWDPAQEGSMDEYIDKIAVPQVREILTNYGADVPAVLWWDTPTDMNKERAAKLHRLVEEAKPNIILNNRLGGGYKGDTETPEQFIPPQGYPGRDWETCMTMNNTWGFKSDDKNFKSTKQLIQNLIDIASKGGNYLLNVGPTSEGVIPAEEIQRLEGVGKWMQTNGESIYGSSATAFGDEGGADSPTEVSKEGKPIFKAKWDWRCTTKPGKLYIHLLKWPEGEFSLSKVNKEIKKAYLLADPQHQALDVMQDGTTVTVKLPPHAPDPVASVLCLETGI